MTFHMNENEFIKQLHEHLRKMMEEKMKPITEHLDNEDTEWRTPPTSVSWTPVKSDAEIVEDFLKTL